MLSAHTLSMKEGAGEGGAVTFFCHGTALTSLREIGRYCASPLLLQFPHPTRDEAGNTDMSLAESSVPLLPHREYDSDGLSRPAALSHRTALEGVGEAQKLTDEQFGAQRVSGQRYFWRSPAT